MTISVVPRGYRRGMADEHLVDRMPAWILPAAVMAFVAAYVARRHDVGWNVLLVVAGTCWQLAAVGYATRSVWPGKLKRSAARFVDWLRRKFGRSRPVELKFGSAGMSSSGFGTLVTRPGFPDGVDVREQVAWLRRTLENLGKEVDALWNADQEIAASARAEARARADDVRQQFEGRFNLSETDAYRAGVMAVLGTLLVLVGDLLG